MRHFDPPQPSTPGRPHRLQVRLTDAEWSEVKVRAEREGVSMARLLVEGVTKGDRGTVGQMRAVIREFVEAKRQVSGAATNLNQVAKVANSTGKVPAEVVEAAERMERAAELLEAAVEEMGGRR